MKPRLADEDSYLERRKTHIFVWHLNSLDEAELGDLCERLRKNVLDISREGPITHSNHDLLDLTSTVLHVEEQLLDQCLQQIVK